MSANTSIEWCHHTFNPWWGCVEVPAPGGGPSECDECYARTFANRLGQKVWGVEAPRRFFGEKHWSEPLLWNEAARDAGERRRVFCASMADVCEYRSDLNPWRLKLWDLIAATEWLDWLLLTKRIEQMPYMAPAAWLRRWPHNVWAGTTTGRRPTLELRVPRLRLVPAQVRFLSIEPLLEDVFAEPFDLSGIHWGILGGESHQSPSRARECRVAWIRNGLSALRSAGAAPFVKQLGSNTDYRRPRVALAAGAGVECPHGYDVCPQCDAGTVPLRDKKGGDPAEWPEDLRVREFPELSA